MRETELARAYGVPAYGMPADAIVKGCLCGEAIVAIRGEEAAGVAAHNRTPPHQIWRLRGGMEVEVRAPEASWPTVAIVGAAL